MERRGFTPQFTIYDDGDQERLLKAGAARARYREQTIRRPAASYQTAPKPSACGP